jgi:23S rRNA (cytosine1962-C5)-methyltransferase
VLPCLVFEDEHLLVVNKPAGLSTHAPSPYAGEGLYEWLRHREPRWAGLAIIHRLDKATSGLILFSKTPLASRSLTAQFTQRSVHKRYLLLTDRPVRQKEFTVKSTLVRAGERYVSRPLPPGGEMAETRFREGNLTRGVCGSGGLCRMLEAEPLTGRTHQIRVHAAEAGIPILGDTLYGGTAAARVYLHAAELTLRHPVSDQETTFSAPIQGASLADPSAEPADAGQGLFWGTTPLPCLALRRALIDCAETNAYRLIHGASDGRPGWYVDRLGAYLLSQSEKPLVPKQRDELEQLVQAFAARGAYHKVLARQVARKAPAAASPQLIEGAAAPERFTVRENGLQYEVSFSEGYSVGLFLDQRDNRRRLLTHHIASGFPLLPASIGNRKWEILNTFAYTCGFSVCAARAGARATSIDLSKRYLEWGKRNFLLNQLDPAQHDFLYGDTLDWLRRLAKKERRFDVVLLDPPTFSQSKESGTFQAQKDYARLVTLALPLLRPEGVLFASTNAAGWLPPEFLATVEQAILRGGRSILKRHYVPQPPDFPVSSTEPAYLKTVWLRVGG